MDATQIATIAAAVSAFAALVSAISGGVAVWFTLRERRAAHRSQLYEYQLQAYQEIFRLALDCFEYWFTVLSNKNSELSEENRATVSRQMFDKTVALRQVYSHWFILLPGEFHRVMKLC